MVTVYVTGLLGATLVVETVLVTTKFGCTVKVELAEALAKLSGLLTALLAIVLVNALSDVLVLTEALTGTVI